MKRRTALCLVLIMLALSFGCSAAPAVTDADPVTVDEPLGTPAPQSAQDAAPATDALTPSALSFSLVKTTVLYPEGAEESDAVYVFEYTIPVFDPSGDIGAKMNESVSMLEDELLTRVSEERIPFADRAEGEEAPSTVVECAVEAHRGYTDILFRETVSYGAEVEERIFALVLDKTGEEASLASASGIFEPEDIAAQQIWNIIDANADGVEYFGDITPESVAPALDLYNGFTVTDEGYTLYAARGTLAPESAGTLEFSFPVSALYPDFVGDAVSVAEYEASVYTLNALAAACAPYYESFANGEPSAFVASAFLSRLIIDSSASADGAYIKFAKADYDALYKSYFTGAMPADIADMGDGTLFEGDSVSIPVLPQAAYSLRLDSALRDGGTLTLTGMLMCGKPGTINTSELAPFTLVLTADAAAPAMFKIVSFTLV